MTRKEITIPAPHGEPSAAEYQYSRYDGVSTADLMVLRRVLSKVPATLEVMAVLGRVTSEFDRRPMDERDAAVDAANEARFIGRG